MNPKRITVAVDEPTLEILDEMSMDEDVSRSKLVRKAIRFYQRNKKVRELESERLSTYFELLSEGEHVILDVDHWLLFLEILESSPEKENFWKRSKKVADSHADQLSTKVRNVEELLERLASCNFFRLNKVSDSEFTLVIRSEKARKFVKRLVQDFSESMEFETDIQGDIGKLRIRSKKEG